MEKHGSVLLQLRKVVGQIASDYGYESNHPAYTSAVVMIAALFVGPDEEQLEYLTGYPREHIDQVASRLRASALWTADDVDYQEWDHRTKIIDVTHPLL